MNKQEQHFKIYKPYGILSQFSSADEKERRKKRFLTEICPAHEGLMPIGRLDEKSEGLLLLTTNGKLSDHINRSGIEKEYFAQLDGVISEKAVDQLKSGVQIGIQGKKYLTLPCQVDHMKSEPGLDAPSTKIRAGAHRQSSWIRITLKEGKFRQIRKMTAAVGFPTLRLIRVRIGNINLDKLQAGEILPIENLQALI